MQISPQDTEAASGIILLVDDDRMVRASTADMLDELSYEVVEAVSAKEALIPVTEGLRPTMLLN